MKSYYILSKSRMSKKDFALLFWGKNSSGYRFALCDAGLYSEKVIETFKGYHEDDMPLEKEAVDALAKEYVIDNTKIANIVINNASNRKLLSINIKHMSSNPTIHTRYFFTEPGHYVAINKRIYKLVSKIMENQK